MDKKLSFGKSLAHKHEELQKKDASKSEENTIVGNDQIVNQITKIISNRDEAMEKFALTPIMKGGKYLLEEAYYNSLVFMAKELRKDVQEITSEYVLRCLKKDLEKFNIPVRKK